MQIKWNPFNTCKDKNTARPVVCSFPPIKGAFVVQKSRLTVCFEDPFWVAVYERIADVKLEAYKVPFGAEPKDSEVYKYFLTHWRRLRFSPPVAADVSFEVVV